MSHTTPDLNPNNELLNEVGQLVLESAFMKYLVDKSETEIKEFESFAAEYAGQEDFIDVISNKYPAFRSVLEEEVCLFLSQKS